MKKLSLLLLMTCQSLISWGQCNSLYAETFEEGNYNNWISAGGSYTYSMETANPSTGNYALKMVGSSGHEGGLIRNFSNDTPTYIRYDIRPTGSVSSNYTVICGPTYASDNNIHFSYWLGASNKIRFVLLNSQYIEVNAQSGTWYKVELKNIDYSTRRYDLYVNDALIQSQVPFRSTTISSVGSFRIYSFNNATNYYDNVILGNQSIELTATSVPATCGQPGSIDLTPSITDGTTYLWSNGATTQDLTNLAGGTYTVHVTNGDCFNTLTTQIGSAQSFTSSFNASTCSTYSWNNETFNTSGSYTRTLQSIGGCDSIVTLHLTMAPPITAVDVQTACAPFQWIDGVTYTADNVTATHTLQSVQGCDSIVTLNLTYTPPLTGTDVVNACGEFQWIDGNTYTEANNSATFMVTSAGGCDSLVTLNLSITNMEVELDWDGTTLSATPIESALYQWYDCSNNQPIPGANTATYTPVEGGNYRVFVARGTCFSETECMNVSGLSTLTINADEMKIFPNPTHNTVSIQSNEMIAKIDLLDVEGKLVSHWNTFSSKEIELHLAHLSNGIYLVKVTLDNGMIVNHRVIKQ